MTPGSATPPSATSLRVEVPGDLLFLPLVEAAARIFTKGSPDAAGLAGEVERQVGDAFREALRCHPRRVSITLVHAPPTLEARVAPVGGEERALSFAIG